MRKTIRSFLALGLSVLMFFTAVPVCTAADGMEQLKADIKSIISEVTPYSYKATTSYKSASVASDGIYVYSAITRSSNSGTNMFVCVDGNLTYDSFENKGTAVSVYIAADGKFNVSWPVNGTFGGKYFLGAGSVSLTAITDGFYAFFDTTTHTAYARIPLEYFGITEAPQKVSVYDVASNWAVGTSANWTAFNAGNTGYTVTESPLSASISLGSDISLNILAEMTAAEAENAVLAVTIHEETTELAPVASEEAGKYYFRFNGISPQCMNDNITLDLNVGGITKITRNISVLSYLNKLKAFVFADADLDGLDDATGYTETKFNAMKILIDDLLVYGGAAQSYVGHNADGLVSDGISGSDRELPTGTKLDGYNKEGITFEGVTVYFDSVNKIMVSFSAPSTEGLVIKCGDVTLDIAEVGEGKYRVTSPGIPANSFDTAYTFKAYLNDVEIGAVTYSVNSYISAKKHSTNELLSRLVSATYNYGVSAVAFDSVEE